MNISVIHPSYGRPKLAYETWQLWKQNADQPFEYIICCATGDPLIEQYRELFAASIIGSPDANMVKQMNHAATMATGDLIIAISDDFHCPKGWDTLLRDSLRGLSDYIVKTQDGVHGEGIDTKKIIAMPIMDRVYYNSLGYVYHPDYGHFYADEELYAQGKANGKLVELDIEFEHMHYTAGKGVEDEINKKNRAHFREDKRVFLVRRKHKFPSKSMKKSIYAAPR